jgi:hypothetical protein
MKILNKFMQTAIFIFELLFCSLQSMDRIDVDKSVIVVDKQPRPNVDLQPTHPKYKTIEYELDKLKRRNYNVDSISLDDQSNKSLAPTVFDMISKSLTDICSKAGIKIPAIVVYVGHSNETYNAMAKTHTELWRETKTITQGRIAKTLIKDSKLKNCTLVIGEGLLKLLLWDASGEVALASIIAHEVGHMQQEKQLQPKMAEFDADARAVHLLGKSKANELIKSINMSVLSGHIFNILVGQADIFRLSLDDVHQLNRIITNSIAKNYYALGDLGQCSSHTKFGHVVNKVFRDALKYSFDPKVGLTEDNFFKIYEKLEKACKNMADFIGAEQDADISLKCAYIEEYSNRYYSPVTHPTPEQRYAHIEKCISGV